MMNSPLTAIVTGGNRGLGLETCRQLAELGYQAILTSRDEEKGASAAMQLGKSVGRVDFYPVDITSDASASLPRRPIISRPMASPDTGICRKFAKDCRRWQAMRSA